MGLDGKNIADLFPQALKMLLATIDCNGRSVSHSVLSSEFGCDAITFLLKEGLISKGEDSTTYWVGGEDKDVEVEWNEKLKSFAYLSLSGKFTPIKDDDLKTYDVEPSGIVDLIAKELDVLPSSRPRQKELLDDILYCVGDAYFQKKKAAIFFAAAINDSTIFKKIEEFFIRQSPTKLPKLILTSSNQFCPESLRQNKAKIISIPKLLGLASGKALFNIDYIGNVLFANSGDELKPYIHCAEDGSILFIGDKSWSIKGDKQRQIIKVMCDSYAENPDSKMRWGVILSLAELDETTSRFNDLFKRSSVKDAIGYGEGFVWFKTENS